MCISCQGLDVWLDLPTATNASDCAQLFEFRGGRPPEGAAAAKGAAAASADSSDGSGAGKEVLPLFTCS